MSTAVYEETEVERVERWRREQLTEAGYGWDLATQLAKRGDVDLRMAVGLMNNGCDEDVAARILL